jgi:hypothetical protein
MQKRVCLFLIFLLASIAGFSQYNQTTQQRKDSIRAEYIEAYPNDFAIWPMLKYKDFSFSIADTKQEQSAIAFNSNNDFKLGAGFYLFEIAFEISFPIPIAVRDESIYGKTKSTDLQVNMLAKSIGLDLYYQRYSGFYKEDQRVQIPPGEAYPQRPDIVTRNLGLSAIYVWNSEKFSIRSSYNYADRQKKSAGSFILYGTINAFRVEGDSAILSPSNQQEFGEGSDFSSMRYTTFSLAPGYSYNLVVNRMFFNATFALGPAHYWIYYQGEAGKEHYDILFNATYTFRLAAGYSGKRFFTGTGIVLQSRALKFQNLRFENSSSVFRIVVGYRFREKKFLKKKPLDDLKI